MLTKNLKVGDVFKTDNSLFVNSQTGDVDGNMIHSISQAFNAKTHKPSSLRKALKPEKGNYVVTNVYSETDYIKLYCASDSARETIINEQSAENNVIEARKLNADGSFNPTGQMIKFSQDKDADGYVREVKSVGKMRQTFIPVGKFHK